MKRLNWTKLSDNKIRAGDNVWQRIDKWVFSGRRILDALLTTICASSNTTDRENELTEQLNVEYDKLAVAFAASDPVAAAPKPTEAPKKMSKVRRGCVERSRYPCHILQIVFFTFISADILA